MATMAELRAALQPKALDNVAKGLNLSVLAKLSRVPRRQLILFAKGDDVSNELVAQIAGGISLARRMVEAGTPLPVGAEIDPEDDIRSALQPEALAEISPELNLLVLARISGVRQDQLSRFAQGSRKPSWRLAERIRDGLETAEVLAAKGTLPKGRPPGRPLGAKDSAEARSAGRPRGRPRKVPTEATLEK
jgi:hypothetical protein